MKRKTNLLILITFLCLSCNSKDKRNYEFSSELKNTEIPEFVFIESGDYTIGSPENEKNRWPKGEEDIRTVQTEGFYISTTEITEDDYYSVMEIDAIYDRYKYLPVVNVSWMDAVIYCNKRSLKEGLTEYYIIPEKDNLKMSDIGKNENSNGYRLPTIDEWEIACRAGGRTAYYTGKKIAAEQANYKSTGRKSVASYEPNSFGLYDMSGNVDEWCWKNKWFTMRKGGSWHSEKMYYLRSSAVIFSDEFEKNDYTGFRVVKNINCDLVLVTKK